MVQLSSPTITTNQKRRNQKVLGLVILTRAQEVSMATKVPVQPRSLDELTELAKRELVRARRNVGSAWRLIEEAKLQLAKSK